MPNADSFNKGFFYSMNIALDDLVTFDGGTSDLRWFKDGTGINTSFDSGKRIDIYFYSYSINLSELPENKYYCVPFAVSRVTQFSGSGSGKATEVFCKKNGKTFSWYNTKLYANEQLNSAKCKYYWFAFTK